MNIEKTLKGLFEYGKTLANFSQDDNMAELGFDLMHDVEELTNTIIAIKKKGCEKF